MLYGFDIGGTNIAFAVYDQALNCVLQKQIATPCDYRALLTVIADLVASADLRFSCTGKVGIGLPGWVDAADKSIHCANVVALKGQMFGADLSAALQRDIQLENDANCFLLSECYGGSGEHCASVLGVTLGTGVGGAIFINGQLYHGHHALAGEIGHYPIPASVLLKYPDLPQFHCACGRPLCLETYVSGTGLSNLYRYYAKQKMPGAAIFEQYRAGETIACQVIDLYFELLAAGLATAILLLAPQALVLGGGVAAIDNLSDELVNRLPKYLLKNAALPKICRARFGIGGARGAALLNYQSGAVMSRAGKGKLA